MGYRRSFAAFAAQSTDGDSQMAQSLDDARESRNVAVSPVAKFQKTLERMKPQIAAALPAHLKAERVARLALTEFSRNPTLQKCEEKSILGGIMTAAQLGLEIGVQGQAYLVPYYDNKNKTYKAQFIPGWRGLVDLVSRSGRGTVFSGAIFKDQRFEYLDGARRDLKIMNPTSLEDPKDITHVYAVGWVRGAEYPIIELWTMEKAMRHLEKFNKVGERHYGYAHPEMYARKVVLLQVLKYMPQSIELANAVQVNESFEAGHAATIDGSFVAVDEDEISAGPPDAREEQQQPGRPESPPPRRSGSVNTDTGEVEFDVE